MREQDRHDDTQKYYVHKNKTEWPSEHFVVLSESEEEEEEEKEKKTQRKGRMERKQAKEMENGKSEKDDSKM